MPRRVRPGARSATCASLLAALLLLTGCGAGFDAVTGRPYNPSTGVSGEAGDVLLRGITLVTNDPGGPAAVVGGVVNEAGAADRLVSVQVAGATEPGSLPMGEVYLPRGELVPLGTGDEAGAVAVTGPPGSLRPGNFVRVRFLFQNAGATTLQVLVQEQTGDFATITPSPSTPTAEPSPQSGEPTPTS